MKYCVMLASMAFLASCETQDEETTGATDQVVGGKPASEEVVEKSAFEETWELRLARVTKCMKAKEGPGEFIDVVQKAGRTAHKVYPYLETVMASDCGEEIKSAALMVYSASAMLMHNGHLTGTQAAHDYLEEVAGGVPIVIELMEDQDRVPTYRDYPHTIDK